MLSDLRLADLQLAAFCKCALLLTPLYFSMISVYHLYIVVRVYIYVYIYICICIYHIFASTSIYQTCGVPRSVPTRDHGRPCDVSAWRGAHLTKPWGVQFVKTSTLWCWFMSSSSHVAGASFDPSKWSTCYAQTENPLVWGGSQLGDGSALPQLHCFSDLSSHKLQRFSVDHPGLKIWNQTASNSIHMVPWTSRLRLRVVEIASQCFPCVCAKRFGGEIGWSSAAHGQSAQKSPLLCYHIWWTKHAHLPGTYFEVIK